MSTERILQLQSRVEKSYNTGRYIAFKVFIDDFVRSNMLDLIERREFDELFEKYWSSCSVYEGHHNGVIPDADMITYLSAEKIKEKYLFCAGCEITVWKILYNCRKNGRILWLSVDDIVTKMFNQLNNGSNPGPTFDELFWHLGGRVMTMNDKVNYYAQIFCRIISQSVTKNTENTLLFLRVLTEWLLSTGDLDDEICTFRLKNVSKKLIKTLESKSGYGMNSVGYMRNVVQLFGHAGIVPDIPAVEPKMRFELFFDVHFVITPENVCYRIKMIEPNSNKCLVQMIDVNGYREFKASYWAGNALSEDCKWKLRLFN